MAFVIRDVSGHVVGLPGCETYKKRTNAEIEVAYLEKYASTDGPYTVHEQ